MEIDDFRNKWNAFNRLTYRETAPKMDLPLLQWVTPINEGIELFIDGNGFLPENEVEKIRSNFARIEEHRHKFPPTTENYVGQLEELVKVVLSRY